MTTQPGYEEEIPQVEKLPWSQLGPEFAMTWGRADTKSPQPEHMEIIGQTGSGKTWFLGKVVQERMVVRHTPCVIICTKPADSTLLKLGWPIVQDAREARKKKWCIFWPTTRKTGSARREYQREKIQQLLDYFWVPNSNTIVVFDDFGYVQSLSPEIRDTAEMYLREGRSSGITCVLVKQRPQGARREMHSESSWTIGFTPKDRNDLERFAELFGSKKEWMPIINSMNPDNHEFLIKHSRTGVAYISWIDKPIRPVAPPKERNSSLPSIYRK